MRFIKRLIVFLIKQTIGVERSIKIIEYVKGIYRYPKMLGRVLPKDELPQPVDILVFAAHPDDEILGLSSVLQRHRKRMETVMVVYVTNGTGLIIESWKAKKEFARERFEERFREGKEALAYLNISEDYVCCLGFPDAGTHRYIKEMEIDIEALMKRFRPKRVYTHCIEGGHNDHDVVSYVVKRVCQKLSFTNVYEWTEYYSGQPMGTENVSFRTRMKTSKVEVITLTSEERDLKRKMLACHRSQDVEQYYMQGEAIRKAHLENMDEEMYEFTQISSEGIVNLRHIS